MSMLTKLVEVAAPVIRAVGIPLEYGTLADYITYYTPEMFGAKGDGVTDDTAAVQAAINASAGKELVFRSWRKYRCKNLTIPHAMTLRAAGRRQGGAIIPYGNEGSFEHSGTFILITAEDSTERGSTVTMFNITVDARGVPLTKIDGRRLNGLVQTDNTSGVYRSGMQLYNCNISGFSGLNIVGGAARSFGIIKDTQSESSDLTVCRIAGVDWRIDHSYFGRSGTGNGIELLNESNVVSHCDFYFNAKSGVVYTQSPGKGFFKMIACTSNSNGEHGVSCTLPYNQPAGIMITECRFWNNSKAQDGMYHNIRLVRGRGHIITNNIHEAYQASAGSDVPRAGFCINLEDGAQPAQLLDSRDNAWSYRNGFCNVSTQNDIGYQRHHIGSFVQLSKGMASNASVGMIMQVDGAAYPVMALGNGGIRFGNGTAEPEHGVGHNGSFPNCTTAFKGLAVQGGYADTYLRVGGWYIWQDDAQVRINRGQPGSASDGSTLPKRLSAVPASATSAGNTGDIAWDSNYAYFCVAFNTWRRIALTTW